MEAVFTLNVESISDMGHTGEYGSFNGGARNSPRKTICQMSGIAPFPFSPSVMFLRRTSGSCSRFSDCRKSQ